MFDILVRILNALLMIALPLVLGVYLSRRHKLGWRLFGIGAVTFIASQVLHIPFNAWVLNPLVEKLGLSFTGSTAQLIVLSLLFGLSAGIFEETARYIVYRFWLKNKTDRTWRSALMFGAGHGGSEAIIVGVLALASFIQLMALRNTDLSTVVPADQLEAAMSQVETYWSLPWYAALLGAVERTVAICFHLSAAVLVLQAFRRKNIIWLFLAIAWHTLLDAVAVFGMQTWGMYVTEALLVAMGIFGVGIVFFLREPPEILDILPPDEVDSSPFEIQSQETSTEILEDSRYV
jgi:uncharacterized membrane protein YhfC